MLLELVQDRLWAIEPSKLDVINDIIQRRLTGDKIVPEAFVQTESGRESSKGYVVRDRIAIIPVTGTLMKRGNVFSRMSGATSMEIVGRQFAEALADSDVDGIVLQVDSPGGTVDGCFELTDKIFEGRSEKPVVAFGDGNMCSAAYAIGSAASKIVTTTSSNIGSVGVVLTHYDYSKADADGGVVRTEIYNGRYKRIVSDTKALSAEGRAYLQEMVDDVYALFVDTVARNRDMDVDVILSMESRIYMGAKAKEAGLVDSIGTLETAISLARELTDGGPTMFTKEQMEAIDAEVAVRVAQASTTQEEAIARVTAELEKERQEKVAVARNLRKAELAAVVKESVNGFKLRPAIAEDPNLLGFMLAIDGTVIHGEDGKDVAAMDWFTSTFLHSADPVIPHAETRFAENGKARSVSDDATKLGEELAAMVA